MQEQQTTGSIIWNCVVMLSGLAALVSGTTAAVLQMVAARKALVAA